MPIQINTTNLQLYEYHRQIQQMNKSIYGIFLNGKINEFIRYNGIRINGIIRMMDEIKNKYFECDENGKIKVTDEEKPQLLYKDGVNKEDYEKEFNEYMSQPTVITV